MLALLSKLIDADKIGGWARAGVASLLAIVIAKFPGLSGILDPATQTAIGVVVSGIVVGIWSQLVKSDAAKIQMAAEVPSSPAADTAKVQMAADVPSTKSIQTTDPVIAAATSPQVTLAK